MALVGVPSVKSVSGVAVPSFWRRRILVSASTRPLIRMRIDVGVACSLALTSRLVPKSIIGAKLISMESSKLAEAPAGEIPKKPRLRMPPKSLGIVWVP